MHQYIFPGGPIPSVPAMTAARAEAGLTVDDELDSGLHYAEILRRRRAAFSDRRADVAGLGSDGVFRRTWDFYLACCEAGFAAHHIDVGRPTLRHR